MSDDTVALDLQEQIARISRMNQETQKLIVEHTKLTTESSKLAAERDKLSAERDKLAAEALKLERDRMIAPWQLAVVMLGSVIGGVSGLVAAILALVHAASVH